jgi:hypothetical protein
LFASDTIKPASFVLPWRGTGDTMRGVDLCGFSDSEGRDTGFIESMVAYLKEEVQRVNVFLLLLNSQEVRVGMHLKDMLVALKNVFGLPFMQNVMIGFTRWDYTRKGAILRRGVTREALSANVNGLLRTLLGHEHDCPCVVLDNTVSMFTDDELQELHGAELPLISSAFEEALEAVRRAAVDNPPFVCADIEASLAERDVGRDTLEREAAAIAKGDEACEAFSALWEEVETDEPQRLDTRMQEAARAAREALVHFLASKTKPDLEHVMESVLENFDAAVGEKVESVAFENKSAAASHNRALRMELAREYTSFVAAHTPEGGGTSHARFDAIVARYHQVVAEYVSRCAGGSLAWGALMKMQEDLRMEQVSAREVIMRKELKDGQPLPPLSEMLNDASALVALLGEQAPAWLRALEK